MTKLKTGLELKHFQTTSKTHTHTQKAKFVLDTVEKVVKKGENAGYKHFLLFPQY